MAEASIWHQEQKTQDWKEHYILVRDGEQTISFILKHNTQTKEVIAEPYSPPDIDYTIHDSCDHENDECVLDDPGSSESEDLYMADKYSRAIDNLEKQVKQQRIVEKLITDKQMLEKEQ
jgi:hypothetical protein